MSFPFVIDNLRAVFNRVDDEPETRQRHSNAPPPYPPFAILKLPFSAAPKGPKQESPGQCPGDPIRMRIRSALKGRNKILDHKPVLPLQGVAILNTRSNSQGGALVVPHNLRPSPAHGRAAATAATVGRGCMSLWTVSRVQSCSETSKSPRLGAPRSPAYHPTRADWESLPSFQGLPPGS